MSNVLKKIKSRVLKSKDSNTLGDIKTTDKMNKFRYHIDSPQRNIISERRATIRGWLIPNEGVKVLAMRIINNGKKLDLDYGIERLDVAKAFPDLPTSFTAHSGFLKIFNFEDGSLSIEVDIGSGFQEIHSLSIKYSAEKLFDSYYNPKLSINWAEHLNLLENKKKYYYEDELQEVYLRAKGDPRLVAFYLPQFHPIPENDRAWGKGFTEWTNVTLAQPRFIGHQQPILPSGLGFYDLRLEENVLNQIDLAKKHGLYGFCFYYYWFSGSRLLEKPLDTFLKHKEWDFNFMICWANENWTKRWDGREKDVIISQRYLKSDPLSFIKDVEHILLDKRYIRKNGKPVLIIYRGTELEDPKLYVKIWRDYFMKEHGQELELVTMLNFDTQDPREYGFDAGVEFAPLTDYRRPNFNKKRAAVLNIKDRLIDLDFHGEVVDHRAFSDSKENSSMRFNFPTHKSVSPSWDNEARKKGRGSLTLYGSNPDLYGEWLDAVIEDQIKKVEEPLVFINAWNEWAEGATLEPTVHNGYSILNRTTEVLAKHGSRTKNKISFPLYGINKRPKVDLAVVIHVFYEKEWEYIHSKLKALSDDKYDLFITITEKDRQLATKIKQKNPNAQICIVPNRGRDVLPFLFLAGRLEKVGYKYALKLHTKKTTHRDDGNTWFKELIDRLLPGKVVVAQILQSLQDGVAVIGPSGHYVSLKNYIGGNKKQLAKYVETIHGKQVADNIFNEEASYGFFAGTMFWCRLDAIKPLLDLRFIPEDFEAEKGQIDGTVAHTLERLLTLVPLMDNKQVGRSYKLGVKKITKKDIKEDYKYRR